MHDENKSLKDSGFCDASENPPRATPNTNSPMPRKLEGLDLFLFAFGNRELTPREREMSEWYGKLHSELQSALREVESLKQDKGRLDWFDSKGYCATRPCWEIFGASIGTQSLRQAIDDAMIRERYAMKEEK